MGAAERWLRSLIGSKKNKNSHEEQETLRSSSLSKSRRWLGWKMGLTRSKREHQEINKGIGLVSTRYLLCEAFNDHSRQHIESWKAHWAAIRIQCSFRRLLARRALKGLKAIVRIQAIIRGWLVRCQFARIRHILIGAMSHETKRLEWCNNQGSIQDIKVRHQQKYDGARKRERAKAYASSQQPVALKRSDFPQLQQINQYNVKMQARQGISDIGIPDYYSGPILSSLTSPASRKGLPCTHKHHVNENCGEGNREGTSPGMTRPGYMEATVSMRAKSKPNVQIPTKSHNAGCHYSSYVCPVRRRRHPFITGIDTHNVLLHCR